MMVSENCQWKVVLLTSHFYYTPFPLRWSGGIIEMICFHLVLVFTLSLSVCGHNRVRSVSSTIPVGSISYLHILSSNLRRCVLCWAARPVHIESDQYRSCSTVKQGPAVGASPSTPIWEQPKTALWLWVREIHAIYTPEECADEWRQNNADLKLLENCVMNGFMIFGIMFMTATGLENSPQSFGAYTVSQSRSVMTSAENPAPDNSPQSIGELRNGHVANLQELYYTRLVKKWRDIKFWYMC